MGGVCYVDLFAGDLKGVRKKIPYFNELGLTYLHLMPLYKSPEINDGGYAVSSYREVNPALGAIEDLRDLAAALQENGISLVLDFVFNHTSDEHDWALKALAGDEDYQDFYLMFPDRTVPDQYEQHLREIFPEHAPGNFTYRREIDRWVWTTFNPFQWDLRYSNPAVFDAMLGEMLFLANVGVEVLRLDAVPFIWKEMGTNCENLPKAHTIIQAFNGAGDTMTPTWINVFCFWVVLILTTAARCSFTRSVKSGSSRASAATLSGRSRYRTGSCRCMTPCSWSQIRGR